MCTLLVKAGASPDITNAAGSAPLHVSIPRIGMTQYKNALALSRTIITNSAALDPNLQDGNGDRWAMVVCRVVCQPAGLPGWQACAPGGRSGWWSKHV